jgi:hypothetical protein
MAGSPHLEKLSPGTRGPASHADKGLLLTLLELLEQTGAGAKPFFKAKSWTGDGSGEEFQRRPVGGKGMRTVRSATLTPLLLIIVIAVLALPGTANTAPVAKTIPVNTTLTVVTCYAEGTSCGTTGSGSCLCPASFWNFVGTAVIPKFGAFSFTGGYAYGTVYPWYIDVNGALQIRWPATADRTLTLALTTAGGETLALRESVDWQFSSPDTFESTALPKTWTVDRAASTGRFADYTGSGTYTGLNFLGCYSTDSEGRCVGSYMTLGLNGIMARP